MPSRFFRLSFAIALFVSAAIRPSHGYVPNGFTWPPNSTITEQLSLGPLLKGTTLQDGFASWDASAADALSLWNQQVQLVNFAWVANSTIPPQQHDGQNSAFFSSTIYGQAFGPNVLAVTTHFNDINNHFIETDTLFNNAVLWNSYRGPLQYNSKKKKYTFDFHRVALHEFGHTLGLGHPDEAGQSVVAIMNSITSNLDHLADDDIQGAHWLYDPRITCPLASFSFAINDDFTFQITGNNAPTSFGAVGLPPGLAVNGSTGLISGRSTVVGTYNITLSATGARGTATAVLSVTVIGPQITSFPPPFSTIGSRYTYQILATNNPFSFDATGLPPGLSVNKATGIISGILTATGNYTVHVVAHTSFGDAAADFPLDVSPPQITSSGTVSANSGDSINYQIQAQGSITNYESSTLPAGLSLNSATGAITGVATLSGNYSVIVTAHTVWGDATRVIYFVISPSGSVPSNLDKLVKQVGVGYQFAQGVIADPLRPHVFIATDRGLYVFDTTTLTLSPAPIISTSITDAYISADKTTLWCLVGDGPPIRRIDLNTLVVTDLPFSIYSVNGYQIRDGLNGRLYLATVGGVLQADLATNTVTQTITLEGVPKLHISADRKTLYALSTYNSVSSLLTTFDVSGPTPIPTHSITPVGNATWFAVQHDNSHLVLANIADPFPIRISKYSTANLAAGPTWFYTQERPVTAAFASNDSYLFLGGEDVRLASGWVGIYDSSNQEKRSITLPSGSGEVTAMTIDSGNNYLCLLTLSASSPQLFVYQLFGRPAVPTSGLANVSTRVMVGNLDQVEIGGFIISGASPKTVCLRAVAPSLAQLGVPGAMQDPMLELHDSTGAIIAANDNWNLHRIDILDTGLAPTDEHESAILATLKPGGYSAVLRGLNNTTGVALVEVFDIDPQNSKLANISTRGNVGTGDNVMIGGFIIGGGQPTRVVVRALGPSLAGLGVSNSLADPTLELHDGNGAVIYQNDNWKSDQQSAIQTTGLPPTQDGESAIVATLNPGEYSAIVRGKNNTTGIALVEVFNLDSN